MPCLRKESLVKLLFNVTCFTAKFLFLSLYHFSLFLAKLFTFFFRTEDEYEIVCEEDEDEDEDETIPELEQVEDDYEEEEFRYSYVQDDHHLVADILDHGHSLVFHVHTNSYDTLFHDPLEAFDDEQQHTPNFDYEVIKQQHTPDFDSDSDDQDYESSEFMKAEINHVEFQPIYDDDIPPHQKSSTIVELKEFSGPLLSAAESNNNHQGGTEEKKMEDTNFTKDEKFLIFAPPKSEAKKIIQGVGKENQVIFEDTYTVGSTSKSSSDWKSSIRDSGTDDPFSSSSRRSCPKWESYAVYQKYDEEMMFLDRISAQKLHETESLRSFQVEPRSISQRILHKVANKKKKREDDAIYKNNPYNELEVAYVAQICLAWETLNWNYANFKRKQISMFESLDPGCPAHIAQQFQQFQVLLQRYIESEPYERGKRPEIYTRMRSVAPKLLQVPEYHDYEGEEQEFVGGRIASALFLQILEDAIQTFMKFLKADRETHCELITALFKQRPRRSIDPTVINVFKKHIKKKKLKIGELQRNRICFRKRKLAKEEEMEILMGLIDLKVVSRVLRMVDITQEQLHWCEAKMGKLRLLDGKLHRDSSPLFFPTH